MVDQRSNPFYIIAKLPAIGRTLNMHIEIAFPNIDAYKSGQLDIPHLYCIVVLAPFIYLVVF
jgi:hypothetical protein